MSEQINVVSDDNNGASGEVVIPETSKNDTVGYETYVRAVSKEKNATIKLRAANDRIAEFEANAKAQEEQSLVEQNKWKELAEQREVELTNVKTSLTNYETSIVRAEKVVAFQDALGEKLAHQDFVSHINTDAIVINEDGTIDSDTLNSEVARFRQTYGSSLTINNNIPTLPNGAPSQAAPKGINDLTPAERRALIASKVKR